MRDIGGLPVAGGGNVRPHLLFRGDAIDAVTDNGAQSLRDLRLHTIIDLREPVERTLPQPDLGADVDMRQMPILRGRFDYTRFEGISDLYAAVLDDAGEELAAVINVLAQPDALPALVHCTAGKDRTGLVIGLILAALEVPDAAVASNYAITEANFVGPARERALKRAADADLPAQRLAVLVGSPPEAMLCALAHVRDSAGSVPDYLIGRGLSRDALRTLHDALVDVTQ